MLKNGDEIEFIIVGKQVLLQKPGQSLTNIMIRPFKMWLINIILKSEK